MDSVVHASPVAATQPPVPSSAPPAAPSVAPPSAGKPRKRRWPYVLLLIVALFLLFLGSLNWVVPHILQQTVPQWLKEKTQRELSIGAVDFNPFKLHLVIDDVALKDADGSALASLKQVELDGNWSSLTRLTWSADKLSLVKPEITARLDKDGGLDWQRFIDSFPKSEEPQAPSDSMPRLELRNVSVSDAALHLLDRRGGGDEQFDLAPIGFALDRLTTLPREQGDYSLEATLDDKTELKWQGQVGFNPVESAGQLTIGHLPIERLRALARLQLSADVTGELGVRGNYKVVVGDDFFSLGIAEGALDVTQLQALDRNSGDKASVHQVAVTPIGVSWARVKDANETRESLNIVPLTLSAQDINVQTGNAEQFALQLKQLISEPIQIDTDAQTVNIPALQFEQLTGLLSRDRNGRLALPFAQLPTATEATPAGETPGATTDAAKARPWQIDLQKIAAPAVKLELNDHSFVVPQKLTTELNLALSSQISTAPQAPLQVKTSDSRLSQIQLRDLSGGDAWLSMDTVELAPFSGNVLADNLTIPLISINGPRVQLTREDAAAFDLERKLEPAETSAPDKTETVADGRDSRKSPRIQLAGLKLNNGHITLRDSVVPKTTPVVLAPLQIQLEPYAIDGSKPLNAQLKTQLASGGQADIKLRFDSRKSSGEADIALEQILLKPFSPYLNQRTRLQIANGSLSSQGKLNFSGGNEASVRYNGKAAVRTLDLTEEGTQKPFVKWNELSSQNIRVVQNLSGLRVVLADLLLDEPQGSIIINPDRSVNLAQIGKLEQSGIAPVETPVVKPKTEATPAPAPSESFRARVERLQITGGDVEFADLSLRPQFGTRVSDLSGLIVGLSNDPASQAEVSLEGKVDEYGMARLSGNVAPLDATNHTNLKAIFRNLEMSSLTPYSGKFAGRAIQSGKLSLDLDYKVEKRKLLGENQVIIDNLVLGEQIDSPDATSLPLDLAIALLSDSNGKIDLGLPVQGSLDDPQFSYGGLVWKAIVNILTKIATAPFRALGSLLGGSGEEFEAIAFEPGEARLLPPEREKLSKLAKALQARPQLKLNIEGRYDKSLDREALADNILKLDISKRAGMKPPAANEPLVISLSDDNVRKALDELATAANDPALTALRNQYLPQPENAAANLVQGLRQRLSPETRAALNEARGKYYPQLFAALKAKQTVPDFAYTALATLRAEAVRNTLTGGSNAFDPVRIGVAAPQEASKTSPDKVLTTLGLAVK